MNTKSPSLASMPTEKTAWLESWYERLGFHESREYLQTVATWRAKWRPKCVRFLLLAESHVAERPGDIDTAVSLPTSINKDLLLPQGFCRLVYCLGYGENDICRIAPSTNGGTWQFWDLFGAVARGLDGTIPAQMPRRVKSCCEKTLALRLAWKLKVLNTLSKAGVWLEDASVIGLYAGGNTRRIKGRDYKQLLRESFQRFVWPGVIHDNPKQVWVIGRRVGRALAGLPSIDERRVVSQPQDRDVRRYQNGLARLVREVTRTLA